MRWPERQVCASRRQGRYLSQKCRGATWSRKNPRHASGFWCSHVLLQDRHLASHEPPVLPLWFPCVLMSFLVVVSCSPPNPSPTSPLSPSWPMFSAPSSPMPTSSTSSDSSPIRSVAGFVWFSVAAVVLSLAWSSLHAVFSLLVNFVPCHPNLHLLFDRPEEAVDEDSR